MNGKVKQMQEQAKQELIAEQKTTEDKKLMSYVCDMVIKDGDKMLCDILEREINDLKYFIIESYSDKEPLNEDEKKSKECFLRYCDNAKSTLKKYLELLKWKDSQQDLIKGKDEYIAKLCNDRAELKEEIKRLDSQYKNIHNTKVKVPLCDILNGLSRSEREKVIEDIYYSQAERQDFYDNKISKLENEIAKLRDENHLLNNLQMFKKFICEGVLIAREQNHTYLQLHLTPELKEWCEKEMNKKVVEKYGN